MLSIVLGLGLAAFVVTAPSMARGLNMASAPAGTAFTYQGRLDKSGSPVTDTCNFQFSLYDAASGGAQVGATVTKNNVGVDNGLFAVDLDFGSSAFDGNARYLQIAVQCSGESAYTTLSGRVSLNPAPYASYALQAPWSGLSGVPAGFADGTDSDTLSGLSCANGQIARWNGAAWACSTDSTGSGNYWSLSGNAGTNPATDFLGTTDNVTLTLGVQNEAVITLSPSGSVAIGGLNNVITVGGGGSTIGGGESNQIDNVWATIGGGWGNFVNGSYATIGGGHLNHAAALTATIAGGEHISATGQASTVGGGFYNVVTDDYAFVGGGAYNNNTGYTAVIGGGRNNTVNASGDFAVIGGGVGNGVAGNFPTVGGGSYNYAVVTGTVIGGGSTNYVSGVYGTIAGGTGNQVLHDQATIAGGSGNVAAGYFATVSGGMDNQANITGTVVSGGYTNTASSKYAAIGGGYGNSIIEMYGVIGGGYGHKVQGPYGVIGGGQANQVSGDASTVAGGSHNQATGYNATVSGGMRNTASGNRSTIPGGMDNQATGEGGFAAGEGAHALHDGAFVWDGYWSGTLSSSGTSQFLARAPGGFWFGDTSGNITPTIGFGKFISTSTGAYLSTGGTWTNASDVNLKTNFAPVDSQAVLDLVAQLPVSTWNYKSQPGDIRHMGPMAQDFYAAFGLGEDDRHISTVDAAGVAFAAIQGLYAQNQALQAENAALQQQVDVLDARLSALEAAAHPAARAPWWLLVGAVLVIGVSVERRK